MHTKNNCKCEEVVSVLFAPHRFDQGEGHHDKDRASECNMDQKESWRMKFGTPVSFNSMYQVDGSSQSSLFIICITVCIKTNIVWDLCESPRHQEDDEEDEDPAPKVLYATFANISC